MLPGQQPEAAWPASCTVLRAYLSDTVHAFDTQAGDCPAVMRQRRLTAGMVASLGADFAAGFRPASLASPGGCADAVTAMMLPVLSAGVFLCLAGARRDPDGARGWRGVLLSFKPFELLAA